MHPIILDEPFRRAIFRAPSSRDPVREAPGASVARHRRAPGIRPPAPRRPWREGLGWLSRAIVREVAAAADRVGAAPAATTAGGAR